MDLYFQQCSILVNARDLAMLAATLANGGVNPVTKEQAIDERYVQDVIRATPEEIITFGNNCISMKP